MFRTLLFLSTAIAAAGTVPATAQTPAAAPAAVAPADQNAAIQQFFIEFDKAELALSPMTKSYRGIRDGDYGKWNDFSDAAEVRQHALQQAAVAQMRQRFDPARLDENNRLSFHLFEKMIERRDRAFPYRDHEYAFDQMNGAQSQLPAFLINIHRVMTKADAEAYVSRLQGLGPAIDQIIAESKTRAAKGLTPPKWVYPYVISDAQNVIKGAPFDAGADAPLYADLKAKVAKLDIPQAEKDALVAAGAKALTTSVKPAYARLIAEMGAQEKLAGTDDGVWRFKDGAAYYAERLSNYTTTALTPDQIHQIGLDNVARIHGEMKAIMDKTGFKGDLQAFFQFMRTDKQFYAPNTDEGRALYLAETEKAKQWVTAKLPQWFGVLPQAPLVVKRVEPFREKSAGKAFYQSPAPDGSRPGTYYANLYDMADMPLFEVEALFYHEGLPGHHLQRTIQTELKDVPPFRQFGGVTAYSEGWGLYSEKLAKDMGLYTDPYRDFGRLQLELHRAIRLVVDTGLHHKRWTREQAIKYVEDNSADAPGGIVKAIERYVVYPGQATAYMIGRLKISELRDKAQKALGDRFDVRGFHDVVLKSGPVPLDVLEEQVDAWIASRKAG
ncbi:Uncharacterized conserved protein, DUF885 familyt [Sphingomonas laterariae]|uniref:Uncharacterized conserved protein, DUF885 familyt n=1 Tax=Edaphosphingomonas laterariae TaxID=861865 RepID=A0A239F3S8_9SPHN|nr:DUF885 domain-containing protein [Sphingomonas laterariae]SNS51485.1 Uncharacterized conserved protein, DUF885 familyt [Sphingomonas laterariae]